MILRICRVLARLDAGVILTMGQEALEGRGVDSRLAKLFCVLPRLYFVPEDVASGDFVDSTISNLRVLNRGQGSPPPGTKKTQ